MADVSLIPAWRPCGVDGCDRRIRRDNRCGLCKRCYNKKNCREWSARNKGRLAGYRQANLERCKARSRASARRWNEANPERAKEKVRLWKQANKEQVNAKERARYAADPDAKKKACRNAARRRSRLDQVDPAGFEAALASGMRQQPCAACQKPPSPVSEIDHIIPLNWAEDCSEVAAVLEQAWAYQPLCRQCNASKGHRYLAVYVATGDIGANE